MYLCRVGDIEFHTHLHWNMPIKRYRVNIAWGMSYGEMTGITGVGLYSS